MKRCKSYHRSNFPFPPGTSIEAASIGASRAGCAQGVALALSRTTVQIAAVVDEEPLGPPVAERAGETLLHTAPTDAQDRVGESGECAIRHRPPSHRGETRDTNAGP